MELRRPDEAPDICNRLRSQLHAGVSRSGVRYDMLHQLVFGLRGDRKTTVLASIFTTEGVDHTGLLI